MIIVSHTQNPIVYQKVYTPIFLSSFFFVSGYTWNKSSSALQYLAKKCKTLGIPFVTLGLINTILAVIADGDPFLERFSCFLISRYGIWDDLWFISCLFSMQFIFYVAFSRMNREKDQMSIALVSLVISFVGYCYINITDVKLPWQFENACILIPFMALGYIYKGKVEEYLFQRIGYFSLFCASVVYVLLSIILVGENINVHGERYGFLPIFLFVAVFGTLLFAQWGKRICDKNGG